MNFKKEVYHNIVMITQVGINMLAPIILCVFVGVWMDEKWGWHTVIPLLILGILAGCRNCYLLLKQMIPKDGGPKKGESEKDGNGK